MSPFVNEPPRVRLPSIEKTAVSIVSKHLSEEQVFHTMLTERYDQIFMYRLQLQYINIIIDNLQKLHHFKTIIS